MNTTKAEGSERVRTITEVSATPNVPSRALEAPRDVVGPLCGPIGDVPKAPGHPVSVDRIAAEMMRADPVETARRALADQAHALTLAGRYDDARAILDTIARLGARPREADAAPVVELDARRRER